MPVISAGLCYVDDTGLVSWLLNDETLNLRSIFISDGSMGHYYRPVILASHLWDKHIWFADERFMHLENIILHVLNALLIYQIADYYTRSSDNNSSYTPLLVSLLFGLHPVNTESVSWICGRSDLFAAFFVFASVLSSLKFRETRKMVYLFIAGILCLFGVLSKEVAWMCIPGMLWILSGDGTRELVFPPLHKRSKYVLVSGVLISLVVGLVVVWGLFSSSHTGSALGDTGQYIVINPQHSFFIFMRALGFYIKKVFWPFPLNFTIYDVDPLYELLGIPCALFFAVIMWRRSQLVSTLVCGLLFLMPAFLVALNRIAWTGYAERYVYISTGFFACAAGIGLNGYLAKPNYYKPALSIVGLLLFVWLYGVSQRSLIWRDNVALLRDSVEKNPTFYMVKNNYAALLMQRGLYNEAREQLRMSDILFPNEQAKLNQGELLFLEGKHRESIVYLKQMISDSHGGSEKSYDQLIAILEKLLTLEEQPEHRISIMNDLLVYRKKRNAIRPDPYNMYRIAQLSLAAGEREVALRYLQAAVKIFDHDNLYRFFSLKLIARLEA